MKTILLLISTLLLVSCGKPKWTVNGQPPEKGGSESRLEFYVSEYERIADEMGYSANSSHVVVQMEEDLGERIMGTCTYSYPPVIRVSRKYWANMSNASREELMFHELGHCALYRGHREDVNGKVPKSIMYPYHLGGRMYKANYNQYVHELFSKQDLASAFPLVASRSTENDADVNSEIEEGTNPRVKCDHGVMKELESN